MDNENLASVALTYEEYHKKIAEYQSQIDALRVDGSDKVKNLKYDIRSIKLNKKIDKQTKETLINQNNEALVEARKVVSANKEQIRTLVKEASLFAKTNYKSFHKEKIEASKKDKISAKEVYVEEKTRLSAEYKEKIEAFEAKYQQIFAETSKEDMPDVKQEYKIQKNNLKESSNQLMYESKIKYKDAIQKAKDDVHGSYRHLQHIIRNIKDGKFNPIEKIEQKFENYKYKFTLGNFFLKNGLFIIIFIFIIVSLIMKPNLMATQHVLLIFKYFSTKVFFALGVAGLILLGGTDLSIGRIIAFSTVFVCLILNPNSTVTFFGISFQGAYSALGPVGSIIVALLVSILIAVIFSVLSGYLTAKFKIHPFISTLGTSLITWGIIAYGTKNQRTGTIVQDALNIGGNIPGSKFPLVIIYALIAIAIVWFIWNKTKFGKNMYAVGGNAEAASVSGISVFWVTIGVFIMAGVLYGFGAFFQATVTGSSSASFGQGWELEAIAACVIGGISFTGGIGKISGAALGCLLFEVMKYYLREISGKNQDIANVFIGVIILVAVTFDSIKYLKKK